MATRLSLRVSLVATVFLVAGPVPAQVADHLQYFKIKDANILLKGLVDLDPGVMFGIASACKISSAKLCCMGSDKAVVTVFNITPLPLSSALVTEDRVCYKLGGPSAVIPDQTVTDRFEMRTFSKFNTGMPCTPAVVGSTFCGNGNIDVGGQCDGMNLGGATCVSFGSGASLPSVDTGDGTITDINTGLVWEKRSDDGGIHDRDTLYSWTKPPAHAARSMGRISPGTKSPRAAQMPSRRCPAALSPK